MAAGTVDGCRAGGRVLLDGVYMAVVMAVEIGAMAGKAAATIATVHRGVTIAIYANNKRPVSRGVALEAIVVVYGAYRAARMAGDAEGG